MKKLRFIFITFFISLVSLFSIQSPLQAATGYSFGIVPQTNGSKLSRLWSPILKFLETSTGIKLRFATSRNISTFEKRLESGKYDFVYMNPYHYVQFNKQQGYTAFAKAKKKRLKGILVTHKDSPYKTLNDLDGFEIAFPSHAFAANLVPRAIMTKADLSYSAKYVSSHDSVYRNISKGRYPVGGGVMRTFKSTSPEFRKQLRILWTSDGYTPHAFAVHPRVPKETVSILQKALLNMDKNSLGKKLLKRIRLKGIESGTDNEWNDVRSLNIKS